MFSYSGISSSTSTTSAMKKLLLVLFGLVLAGGCAEVLVRIVHHENAVGFYMTDPATGLVVMRPNVTGEQRRSCYTNTVITNSLGWRDKEFSVEKPTGTYRIEVLGDSFVAAFEVPLEKAFHSVLERELNTDSTSTVEVLSLGKGGNGLYYDYRYLKEFGLRYQPDLVLVMSFKNDPSDDLGEEFNGTKGLFTWDGATGIEDRTERYRSSVLGFVTEQLRASALARFVYDVVRSREGAVGIDAEGNVRMDPVVQERGMLLERALLLRIRDVSTRAGVPLVVATVPDREQIESSSTFAYVENLRSVTRDAGIPFLDLTPVFKERAASTSERYDFECDPHWNEVGHAWAAEALAPFLRSLGDSTRGN